MPSLLSHILAQTTPIQPSHRVEQTSSQYSGLPASHPLRNLTSSSESSTQLMMMYEAVVLITVRIHYPFPIFHFHWRPSLPSRPRCDKVDYPHVCKSSVFWGICCETPSLSADIADTSFIESNSTDKSIKATPLFPLPFGGSLPHSTRISSSPPTVPTTNTVAGRTWIHCHSSRCVAERMVLLNKRVSLVQVQVQVPGGSVAETKLTFFRFFLPRP